MNKKMTWIVAGAGAVALFLWYRSRSGSSGFGASLAGQGAAGSTLPNLSFGGTSNGAVSPDNLAQHEAARNRARNEATGPQSRGACLYPMRWIDTETGPYFGFCVTQAMFDQWVRVSPQAGVLYAGLFPTNAQVQATGVLRSASETIIGTAVPR